MLRRTAVIQIVGALGTSLTPVLCHVAHAQLPDQARRDFLDAVHESDARRAAQLWTAFLNRYGRSDSVLSQRAKRYNDLGLTESALVDLTAKDVLKCPLCVANKHFEHARASMHQHEMYRALDELKLAKETLNTGNDLQSYDVHEADVLELRAWVHFGMNNFKDALGTVNQAIKVGLTAPSPRLSRSVMLVCVGKGRNAGRDAQDYLKAVQGMDRDLAGIVVVGYFGFVMDGAEEDARELCKAALARRVTGEPGQPYLQYIGDEISGSALRGFATNDDGQMTDVQCFTAVRTMLRQPNANVKPNLDWLRKEGRRDRPTYRLGLAASEQFPERGKANHVDIVPMEKLLESTESVRK
jgi:hypothetical protein